MAGMPPTCTANLARPGHPVIEEVRRRLGRARPAPPTGDRGAKLGLVVEGGGMRGAISGGVLLALEEVGCTEIFDEAYAESAGAINAAYFLAGQAGLGSRIYYEDAASARFINPLRLRPVVDIDFLVDEVFAAAKPLDAGAVARSRTRAFFSVTNARDGSARTIDVGREAVPLLHLLKATAAIVPLYHRAVPLDGGMYVDGGISDPIPVGRAIASGCTHILVVVTRPRGFRFMPFSGGQRLGMRFLLGRRWSRELVRVLFHAMPGRYNVSRDLAFGTTPPDRRVHIAVICPDGQDAPQVDRLTRDPGRLKGAMMYHRRKTLELLRGSP